MVGLLVSPTRLAVEPFLRSRLTRNRVGMADLAALALLYVARVSDGDKNPARSLASEYPATSVKTWQNLFNKARNFDLLGAPPRRGVAGGELTDKAQELITGTGKLDDESLDWWIEEQDYGPDVHRMHSMGGGKFVTDVQLSDLMAEQGNTDARRERGVYTEAEHAIARRQGGDLARQAAQRWSAYVARTRANNLALIRECQSVQNLRELWATGRDALEGDDALMAAWRLRGSQLSNPVISSPETMLRSSAWPDHEPN
jgi:hypothetical protein